MTKVLILGANGQLARNTTKVFLVDAVFLEDADFTLTLYLRRAGRLTNPDPRRVAIVEGDVLDAGTLRAAMQGQDVVYANLAGDMARQATAIIDAMHATGVKRLIFISSMGIYGEVPGERYRSILDPYRDSAALIEQSDLDFTILRPGWFTRDEEVSYHITQKGEAFEGHDVSLNSLSDLIVKLAKSPALHARCSLGIGQA
ncbi:NAD(P)H-binding protein [Mesorhizobium onobrychidis]|uniref:NAD(P)H-binding protein n=1 Tax=Mesorhizobium onobrychidis TaxID=2775404 RepID=A0ABY5R4I8_9HYPH|nr:NAD(P)H-binding protein [Mesorhizobium onobrychidis]UVC18238.1 NAD(P)H-binding protein [Mesorhizobium onobrychidis]